MDITRLTKELSVFGQLFFYPVPSDDGHNSPARRIIYITLSAEII